jgi:hypothetical protein
MSKDGITLITISILADIIPAFVLIYFMQVVTSGAGVRCQMALLLLFHRSCYLIAICALAIHAWHIYDRWEAPSLYGLFLQVSWMVLCVGSFARHRLAPAIPMWATWRHPAGRVKYGPQH